MMNDCGVSYCYDGIKKFCHMDDTNLQHEIIENYSLYGLFPCVHLDYTEWADWYNHWMDDVMRYYRINEERE
jgi:hypothetical protein